jgi:nucleotide-binding universal stress UspA family protein
VAATGAAPLALCVLPRDTYDVAGDPRWRDPRRLLVEGAVARHPELCGPGMLTVRQGQPVGEILQHLAEVEADLLVLGIRQGGPGGDPGSGHVARDLLRVVPTAVLAVPI